MTEDRVFFKCPKCKSLEWRISVKEGDSGLILKSVCGNAFYIHSNNFEGFVNSILDLELPLK